MTAQTRNNAQAIEPEPDHKHLHLDPAFKAAKAEYNAAIAQGVPPTQAFEHAAAVYNAMKVKVENDR